MASSTVSRSTTPVAVNSPATSGSSQRVSMPSSPGKSMPASQLHRPADTVDLPTPGAAPATAINPSRRQHQPSANTGMSPRPGKHKVRDAAAAREAETPLRSAPMRVHPDRLPASGGPAGVKEPPLSPPARGRAECPDLDGQRHDRNPADVRAERRIFARTAPVGRLRSATAQPPLSVSWTRSFPACAAPAPVGPVGL